MQNTLPPRKCGASGDDVDAVHNNSPIAIAARVKALYLTMVE